MHSKTVIWNQPYYAALERGPEASGIRISPISGARWRSELGYVSCSDGSAEALGSKSGLEAPSARKMGLTTTRQLVD